MKERNLILDQLIFLHIPYTLENHFMLFRFMMWEVEGREVAGKEEISTSSTWTIPT